MKKTNKIAWIGKDPRRRKIKIMNARENKEIARKVIAKDSKDREGKYRLL